MYTQKLYKNGNSVVVSIPVEYLKTLGLRAGSWVTITSTGQYLIIRPKKKKKENNKKNFYKLLEKVNEEYGDVLKELVDK